VKRVLAPIVGLLFLASATAPGAAPDHRPRGPWSEFASGRRPDRAPGPVAAAPGLVRNGRPALIEVRLGVPTFLWAGPEGRLDPGKRSGAPLRAEDAARIHLGKYGHLYRLESDDIRAARVRKIHDTGRGPLILSFVQEVDGIEVFRDEMKMALDRGGDLIAISGYLTRPDLLKRNFDLGAEDAIAAALADLTGYGFTAADLKPAAGAPRAGYSGYQIDSSVEAASGVTAAAPPAAKRVFFRLLDGLEPAWVVVLDAGVDGGTDGASWGYVISATDGRLLMRQSFTRSESYGYRVWADPNDLTPYDGPQGTDPSPHPTGIPNGYQPALLPPNFITLESGPISTGDPWLPPASSVSLGNNVDAYADIVSPDGFTSGDLRASTTSTNVFDRVYDTTVAPDVSSAQRQASITQIFYTNNWLHDWFYDAGFDEVAGNAQHDNYGRGGVGGDRLLAEGQDYSGLNNANMSTPPDGFSPRMQMYIFSGASGQVVEVNSPAPIAGALQAAAAAFGPADFDITGDVVLVNDGVGTLSDGCETPFSVSVSGLIALIDRGTCSFIIKVQNAQSQGAVGVLVVNNVAGAPITMGGTGAVTIPSLMISQDAGTDIKASLPGVNVRMQREVVVNRDGTIDNSIIAHEWGHYISNRLVGNAFGLDTQQSAGMGEGWGDFTAILMAVRPEDANAPANPGWVGAFSMSGYPESAPGSDSYYWSIRRTPLSTDFGINPLTFRHIENGVALPLTAPLQFGQSGASNSEVHNTGEIWANMLWECYASLLRETQGPSPRLVFAEAQQRMKEYLVGGYKLTPNSPTFVEARDAILATVAASDTDDLQLFWQAFAKRGLGVGAVAPDRFSGTNAGVVESFSTGGSLDLVSITIDDDTATNCLPDGELDEGETGTMTVTLQNDGGSSLSATTGATAASNPAVSFPSGTSLSFTPSVPFGTAVATVPIALSGAAGAGDAGIQVIFDDPGLIVAGPIGGNAAIRVNTDEIPGASASDDVEAIGSAWSPEVDTGISAAQPFSRVAVTALQHHWLGPDAGSLADIYLVSPPLQVSAVGNFGFSFSHRHSFESGGATHYDGGVIEISTNGGASWSDIGAGAVPGYGGTITTGGGNPIEGRPAYVSTSASYPNFQAVNVSLGTAYQGQSALVRFRIGTDIFVGATGWEIDNLSFTGIVNTPFPVVMDHDPTCDMDIDGFFDAQDCAPGDNQTWQLPSAITDLSAEGGAATSLAWPAPASSGGTAPATFDLIRSGTVAFGAGSCLASNTSALSAADGDIPAPIFYYLVGSRNGCGRSIQPDSDGFDRGAVVCVP
jgi:hypothetical protein